MFEVGSFVEVEYSDSGKKFTVEVSHVTESGIKGKCIAHGSGNVNQHGSFTFAYLGSARVVDRFADRFAEELITTKLYSIPKESHYFRLLDSETQYYRTKYHNSAGEVGICAKDSNMIIFFSGQTKVKKVVK